MTKICTNCGWKNPDSLEVCEKCRQPLPLYGDEEVTASAAAPAAQAHNASAEYRNASAGYCRSVKTIINDRYELTGRTLASSQEEIWAAKDLCVDRDISVVIPPRAIPYLNLNTLHAYQFLADLKIKGALSPLYYDTTDNRSFYVIPRINRSITDFIGEIGFDLVEHFFIQLIDTLADSVKKKHPIGYLSPVNILVSPPYNLCLTARAFASFNRYETVITGQPNTLYMPFPYLAPEFYQSHRAKIPTHEGDVWALGALIYELITGQTPFGDRGGESQLRGERLDELFYFHSTVEQNFRRLDTLRHLVSRCMQPDPTRRPSPLYLKNSLTIRTHQSETNPRLYTFIHPDAGVIYSIECDSLSGFSAMCLPAGGPPPPMSRYFMGAFFQDGDECGYLRLEEDSRITEYQRMSKSQHRHLCALT